jgi:hypothetical protein
MIGDKTVDIKFDGKGYTFRKITIGDRENVKKYIRKKKIQSIDESIDDKELKKDMIIAVAGKEVSEEEVFEFMQSDQGVLYLFWNQTDYPKSFDEFLNELNIDGMKEIIEIAMSVISGDDDDKESKQVKKKVKR